MYEFIKGKAENKDNQKIVIENNGIGYGIFTSLTTLSKINVGDEVKLYTYLHVREDQFSLFGFMDEEELVIFKMLISISGVGPKASIAVLSTLSTNEFAMAVATNDDKTISKANGIGKKTSQRIILELKDKFKNLDINDEQVLINDNINDELLNEAKMALMVLGYKSKDAIQLIGKVYDERDSLEDIIKKALRAIG
ncbi:MAG: Holliday junction branch migration protein RuvA [Clostridiales bacterium]|nr:Holliday junction branch migration protein RuvA [Clostridiales bacterium]